jgi:hypothetical protein
MAIVVETGAGLSNADALASVAFCDSYHLARLNSTWVGSDEEKESAIRRATMYLSDSVTWSGIRTKGRDQALAWPRASTFDKEGFGIDTDIIPIEIKNACAELALQELVSPGSMTPTVTISATRKREKIGAIEVEYANASLPASSRVPAMLRVQALIAPFIDGASGASSLVGSSYRA